jgi:hypothetical protein
VAEMLIGQLFLVTAVAKVISAFQPVRLSASRPGRPTGNPTSEARGPRGPLRRRGRRSGCPPRT